MQLKFVIINKTNLELACSIQRRIFPDEDARENYIESINKAPYRKEAIYWLVLDKDEVIGISGLYADNKYPDDAWMGWFGVLPEKRNRGYASQMFDYFEDFAKEREYKTIRLYSDEIYQEAKKLYLSKGMICEKYNNQDEEKEHRTTTIIFSKSLTDNPTEKWNDKYLGLTEQGNKTGWNKRREYKK